MGAFSTNLPTLLMVSGPRPVAHFEGRRIGTGTDLWRLWDQRRSGELSDERWADLERALTLGKGTCNTMGTASTMGGLAETLGLAWPGSTTIPAGDGRHLHIAHHLGERADGGEGEEFRKRRHDDRNAGSVSSIGSLPRARK